MIVLCWVAIVAISTSNILSTYAQLTFKTGDDTDLRIDAATGAASALGESSLNLAADTALGGLSDGGLLNIDLSAGAAIGTGSPAGSAGTGLAADVSLGARSQGDKPKKEKRKDRDPDPESGGAPVPEPSTWAGLITLLVLCLFAARAHGEKQGSQRHP